jgi:hypothetical protein
MPPPGVPMAATARSGVTAITLTAHPLPISSTPPFANLYTPVSAPIQMLPLASSLKARASVSGTHAGRRSACHETSRLLASQPQTSAGVLKQGRHALRRSGHGKKGVLLGEGG